MILQTGGRHVGGNFHQVQACFDGHFLGIGRRQDAQHFACRADDANGRNANLFVHAMRVFDRYSPLSDLEMTAAGL